MEEKYLFGIDLGGTTIKMGLIRENGEVVEKWEIPTNKENEGVNIVNDIHRSFQRILARKGIDQRSVLSAGIGVPSQVIEATGYFHKAVNIGGFGDFSITDVLSEVLEMPVAAANDANVAAIGEMWQGAGLGEQNIVMVTLGTGVGGGVVINGHIVSGSVGAGGEIGHMPVVLDANDAHYFACNCGAHGCLETVASATGIVRLARVMYEVMPEETILKMDERYLSAKQIFEAGAKNDHFAKRVIDQFGKYLATSLKQITAVLNPSIIVIGGGVSRAGQQLIDAVEKHFRGSLFPILDHSVQFRLATLGNDAGIIGAAYIGYQKVGQQYEN